MQSLQALVFTLGDLFRSGAISRALLAFVYVMNVKLSYLRTFPLNDEVFFFCTDVINVDFLGVTCFLGLICTSQ